MSSPFQVAPEQPYGVTVTTTDGVKIVQMIIPRAGTIVPQHAHKYAHTTMVAHGSVRVETAEGSTTLTAGARIYVPAGDMHCLTSLEDGCICYCIHNVGRTGDIEIEAENSYGCTRAPEAM